MVKSNKQQQEKRAKSKKISEVKSKPVLDAGRHKKAQQQ